MKRFVFFLLTLVFIACLAVVVLHFSGAVDIGEMLARLPGETGEAIQSAVENTAQRVQDGAAQLYNKLNGYEAPTGTGAPLEGDLPEDQIPDAADRYSFPAEFYPYRAMLSAPEQSAYDQIYANALELYTDLPLHTPLSADSVARAFSAVYYDHPELFWMGTGYRYFYSSGEQVVAMTLLYNDTAADIDTHRAHFDKQVQEVVRAASRHDAMADRERYVHDWLVDNVSYQLDAPLNQSAYSAMVYGETVCAGYARAFQVILRELGIPVYYCVGYAGESHAWNIVKLEDGYYNVDVTWDDPLGNTGDQRYYNYFNLTDDQIAADHTRSDLSLNLPACNATGYSYRNYFAAEGEAPTGATAPGAVESRRLEDLGLRAEDALTSLPAYYEHCRVQLVERGEGTHTFTLLVEGRTLLQQIFSLTESNEAIEAYAADAAHDLGFGGYRVSVSLQAEELAEGYWLLTQQVSFQGQGSAPEPSQPAPSQPEPEPEQTDPPPDRVAEEPPESYPPPPPEGEWPDDPLPAGGEDASYPSLAAGPRRSGASLFARRRGCQPFGAISAAARNKNDRRADIIPRAVRFDSLPVGFSQRAKRIGRHVPAARSSTRPAAPAQRPPARWSAPPERLDTPAYRPP